jgi:pyruvate formate lyase activating enzyme
MLSLMREGVEYFWKEACPMSPDNGCKGDSRPFDFTDLGKWLRGAPKYFIQNFKASGDVIARGLNPCSKEELEAMLLALRQYIPAARLRGED